MMYPEICKYGSCGMMFLLICAIIIEYAIILIGTIIRVVEERKQNRR